MNESIHDMIIQKYFSNENKEVHLKAGEVLLKQYELNKRLYYIEEGKLCGYLPDKSLHEPVFEAETKGFVGVYSFFSTDSISYSLVVAERDSIVRYFDGDPFILPEQDAREFLTFLFNIVVSELRHRQHFAGKMAQERQETLQKLIQSEKMITLGQMAAGLAHELNNTIASLSSNLRQMKDNIALFLEKNEPKEIQAYFNNGVKEGQKISSAAARELRDNYSKFDYISKLTAKKLSR
ncbi:MAG: cyclic nucleotide-binding domain-containing protein, partial [Bacteroidota bacterium]